MTPQMKQLAEWRYLVVIFVFPLLGWLTNSKNLVVYVLVLTGLILIVRLREGRAVLLAIVAMMVYPFLS